MKGKILGYSEADGSGAISADDGSRHRFTRADWRGDKPPATGMVVDFESSEGAAKEIYPVGGAALAALGNINVDLSGLSGSAGGARATELFTKSLAVPLALVVLLACFLTALSSPMKGVSLIGLGDAVAELEGAARMASMMGGGGDSGLGGLGALLILRFAAPLAALWLVWAAWAGKAERLPMLVTGAATIVAALLVVLVRQAVLSAVPDMARDMMASQIHLGLGVWLLLLSGAGLIAGGLGLIRNPLARG
ncbi:hypothetical protein [Sphingopyxis panaciterrulae]|uniref:Uncharacterized protein n=1 Tax=Sphingopyxis panaciterrulae TaxID=462372 RepID=A0A7W9EQF7_9SPHN|nr:hypothetical protein [Sphingopyxis panaciterrulae]MBB5705165.1 hypothetical protein [Sphingopyxis panaciterrulae]